MHTGFGFEEAEGVGSLDLEHRALDARLFALAHIEDLVLEAFAFGPARVHTHQHFRPVLGFGATGARADLELRVTPIVRPAQERTQTERFEVRRELLDIAVEFGGHVVVGFGVEHLGQLARAAQALLDCAEGVDPGFERFDLLHDGAGLFLVIPETHVRHLPLEAT